MNLSIDSALIFSDLRFNTKGFFDQGVFSGLQVITFSISQVFLISLNVVMARSRDGRYEEHSSRRERNTLYDQPRSDRCYRDDRSYD